MSEGGHPEPRRRPLADRVAVVTGSSSGIGRAIALELGRRGAAVVVTSREYSRAETTAAVIESEGGRAAAVAVELTQPGAGQRLVDRAHAEYGRLDVLVNNAGVGQVAASETLAPEDFRRVIDLDLVAPFECAQAAARVMLVRAPRGDRQRVVAHRAHW